MNSIFLFLKYIFKRLFNVNKKCALLVAVLVFLMVFICLYYVGNEHNIYVWDYIGRMQDLENMNLVFRYGKLSEFVSLVRNNISKEDYNVSTALPLLLFQFIFGQSRQSYVLLIVLLYQLPLVLLFLLIYKRFVYNRIFSSREESKLILIVIAGIATIWAPFWGATLRGYTDISSIIPLAILYYLFYAGFFNKKLRFFQTVLLGVLLWMPFLMRRWNVYTLITFLVSVFIIYIIEALRKNDKENLVQLFFNILKACSVSAICVLIFQHKLIVRIFKTSYVDLYDAYQGQLLDHIVTFYDFSGPIVLFFVVIGISGLLNCNLRKIVLLPLIQGMIYIYLFTRIQLMGAHHYLPIGFITLILFSVGVTLTFMRCKVILKFILLLFVSTYFVVNFLATFFVKSMGIAENVALFQKTKFYGLQHPNYNEFLRLGKALEDLVYKNSDRVSVFSSNVHLSDSTFHTSNPILKEHLICAGQVDKVNQFSLDNLLSRFVVVTNVPVIHLKAGSQQVIERPCSEIYAGVGIGCAYRKVTRAFDMGDGVNAYIYEKVRDLSKDEIQNFLSGFYSSYPEWAEKYPPLVDKFIRDQEKIANSKCKVEVFPSENLQSENIVNFNTDALKITYQNFIENIFSIEFGRYNYKKDHMQLLHTHKKSEPTICAVLSPDKNGCILITACVETPVNCSGYIYYWKDDKLPNKPVNESRFVLRKGVKNVLKIKIEGYDFDEKLHFRFRVLGNKQPISFWDIDS